MSKLLSVNLVSGQKVRENRYRRLEKVKGVLLSVMKSIQIYGDQHLSKLSTENSTTSATANLQMSTSFQPKTKPLTPIKSMKPGYLLSTMFISEVYAPTEVENIWVKNFSII